MLERPTRPHVLLGAVFVLAATLTQAEDLPRRGMVGVQLAPVTEELRSQFNIPADVTGVVVGGVVPGSAAAEAGLERGDVIFEIDGRSIAGVADIGDALRSFHAGDTVSMELRRGADTLTKPVTLKPRPQESSDAFDIRYDVVMSQGQRLRTIITRPPGAGPFPALLFIQGLTCATVEGVPLYTNIFHPLTEAGFVTMRVEKPGVGDSEGDCAQLDFEGELDIYRQALRTLKAYPFVDKENVFIFGHSMGGLFGPLVAGAEPVRGLAVYGTAIRTWIEYTLENNRRQAQLAGASFEQVEQTVRHDTIFWYELLAEKRTPEQIAERHAELKPHLAQFVSDGTQVYGRHYRFFQQLYDVNLAAAWAGVDGQVLALYGKSDFVTDAEDHRLIAEVVNRAHPRRADWRILGGIDHAFRKARDQQASFAQMSGATPAGDFNPLILETLREWLRMTVKNGSSQP